MSLTEDQEKRFLKSLENRTIDKLSILYSLSKQEAKIFLEFLNSPDTNYSKFSIILNESDDVIEALKAIKNRYSFIEGEINTEEPVSKEAEELALSIIDTHFDCSIYLNSEVQALRPTEKRNFEKTFAWS